MYFEEINIDQTHIRLTSDLDNSDLKHYIYMIRQDLKRYISLNQDFLISMEPLRYDSDNLTPIVLKMYESSAKADVGPMACVAGTISEMSLNYLIENGSDYSIVENGGDIALINDQTVLCGIYSNNERWFPLLDVQPLWCWHIQGCHVPCCVAICRRLHGIGRTYLV